MAADEVDSPNPVAPFARRRPSARTSAALLVLALALVAGAFLRAEGIALKRQLYHDEAITYLAAAGHEEAYATLTHGAYGDHWTAAARYQDLLKPDSVFSFGRIARDLDHTDNHPPLYFWVLHIWLVIFGLRIWSGLALNLIIALGTSLALFGLARRVLGDPLEASLVSLIWVVSPPVVETSLMARHYDLFALVTVLFVWALVVFSQPTRRLRWRDMAILAAITAAGAATHYHFALVLVAGGIFAVIRLARHAQRLLLQLAGAVAVGLLLFVAMDPQFYLSITRQRAQQTHTPTLAATESRARTVWPRLEVFFATNKPWALRWRADVAAALRHADRSALSPRALLALLVGAALAPVVFVSRWRRQLLRHLRHVNRRGIFILSFLVVIAGETVALYVTFQSPGYAMVARYLAAVWPFMAFVPILLGRLFGRAGVIIVLIYCLAIVLPAGQEQVLLHKLPGPNPAPVLASARAVVITTLGRGDLPRITWFIPGTTPVFAASPRQLVQEPDRWQGRLQPGDIVVLCGSSSSGDQRELGAFVALLSRRFAVTYVPGGVWGVVGKIYRLELLPADTATG
jgi:uncharacterized membrane protein